MYRFEGEQEIVNTASSALEELLQESNIDDGHGIQHAQAVLNHTLEALNRAETEHISNNDHLIIALAALLHDADDRKFFPKSDDNNNARIILNNVLPNDSDLINKTINIIDMVSFSKNGNKHFYDGDEVGDKVGEEFLYPCLADRCEATGHIGIQRCFQYTIHTKRPLYNNETPRCRTVADIERAATDIRLNNYLAGHKSVTMIDHYYDKLLHLTNIPIKNTYFRGLFEERHQILVDYLINFNF